MPQRLLSLPSRTGWPMLLTTILASLLTLWCASSPDVGLEVLLLLAGIWLLLGTVWLVRAVLRVLAGLRCQARDRGFWLPGWKGCLVVLLPVLTLALLHFEVPFRLAFAVSRPAMERLVQQVQTLPPGSKIPSQRVGVYWADDIEQIPDFPGGVRFFVGNAGFIDKCGFAYSTTPLSGGRYQPLGAGWYTWYWHF